MPAVISILFGAAFTVATAWAMGALLFRRLGVALGPHEEPLLAFITGSACLSEIVFFLSSVHMARTWVFLILGVIVLGLACVGGGLRSVIRWKSEPLIANVRARWVFFGVCGIFAVLYFINALAPEASPDGSTYHLGTVLKYFRAHGFLRITTDIYASISEGVELLFLFAFSFGKHSSTAMLHYAFLIALTLLMVSYGRRIGHPVAGVAAAIFFYASPVVGLDGTIAYNDVALAAVLFSLFYLLQIWDETRDCGLLIPVGILAGWSYAIKYTAFLAVPYALAFVLWRLYRSHKPILRHLVIISGIVAVFVLPWIIKNWIWVGNPVSPFANQIFPNPYVHVSFEADYRRFMRIYNLTSYSQIPLQLTVKGDILAGLFGPLFLLTPLALLALRFRAGRQLWLAAFIFGLPYATNVGTRFLIPSAPFLSLALALSFANWTWLLLGVAVLHAVSCWPDVLSRYCSPTAWRLNGIPLEAALRIEPQDQYLAMRLPEYSIARMVDRVVPRGERVFSFSSIAEAYTDRDILVRYEAALNEKLGDTLWTAMIADFQPTKQLEFHFAAREVRALRVVRTGKTERAQWSIAEFRIFHSGAEVPRAPEWRLSARPYPWDIQLAFDNTPATRWRSWQAAEPGMFVQADLGHAQTIDLVTLETSNDSAPPQLRLEGEDTSGKWSNLSESPLEAIHPIRVNMRQAATAELKALGIRYVLIRKDDIRADDFIRFAPIWGLKLAGAIGDARLYHIE